MRAFAETLHDLAHSLTPKYGCTHIQPTLSPKMSSLFLPQNPKIFHHSLCLLSLTLLARSYKPPSLRTLSFPMHRDMSEILNTSFDGQVILILTILWNHTLWFGIRLLLLNLFKVK